MDKIFDSPIPDPPRIANEVNKLQEAILQKKSDLLVLKEIDQLKTLCGHKNPVVNLTASNAVSQLVEWKRIDLITAYSWLSSSILGAKNLGGLIQLSIDLFRLDLAKCKENSNPIFLRHSLEHPLVHIFDHPEQVSRFTVLVAVRYICENLHPHGKSFQLVKPVFEHIFSCDGLAVSLRNAAWDVLVDSGEIQQLTEFLSQFVHLAQSDAAYEYLHIVDKLLEKSSDPEVETLLISLTPIIASVIHHLIKTGTLFEEALHKLEIIVLKSPQVASLVLSILAEALSLSSTRHLSSVSITCLNIMKTVRCSTISEHMLVASLARWLIQPTQVCPELPELASAIIGIAFSRKDFYNQSSDFCKNYTFQLISSSHRIVQKSVLIHGLGENLPSKENHLKLWLNSKNTKFSEFSLFLGALLISYEDRAMKEKVIRNLSELRLDQYLALLVFQLVREKDPKVQSTLLTSMHLCINKDNQENKMIFLQILKGLSASSDPLLREESIYLHFLFWKIERRCFPFLHTLLVSDDVSSYEIELTKAKVINEICKISPEIYGKSVARPIADILNKSKWTKPCMLALNSVALLCKAGEIDIRSTWKAIKPKFINDKRPDIIAGLCEILSLVPNVYSYTDRQEFFTEVVTNLWNFVTLSSDEIIVSAALKAFTSFRLEHLSVETLPDVYKKNAGKAIETSFAISVAEFVHVPGKCWLNVLESLPANCADAVVELFTKWLSDEIATFHSGIYSKVLDEPSMYTFLQERSLCRTFVDYIRKHSSSPTAETTRLPVSLCLRILSSDLPKPLPPLKWAFLSNYMNEGSVELKMYSTKLVIKQSMHKSSSANNVLEAKLSNLEFSEETETEILNIFQSLKGVMKSVHPTTCQGFLSMSLQYTKAKIRSNETGFFCSIVDSIRSLLAENHPENDKFLFPILHDLWTDVCDIPACSESLMRCISVLSDQNINMIFPPPESGSSNLHPNFIKLMCGLAAIKLSSESIDRLIKLLKLVCANRLGVDHRSYLQSELLPIFALPIPHITVLFFVKGLMGLLESCQDEDLEYLCAILFRVLIVYSGLSSCPTEEYSSLPFHSFPFALTHFIRGETDSFLTFFKKMLEERAHEMNISFSLLFRQCCIALRNVQIEYFSYDTDYFTEALEKGLEVEEQFLKIKQKE
ncbi:unnamed protein product [Bemisia tabaci]|uniref:DUF3730 domain-containing protein n=1 Tax=Bemisia tabaci TaxID=7038 RepID=A0A9P0EX88_BEMTA|nr:unnamed protein product [Bemisia tabaci]